MSDSTKHCKLGILVQTKSLTHPREKVSETEMSTFDTLRNTSTTTSEREGTDTIRTECHIRIGFSQLFMRSQNISAVFLFGSPLNVTIWQNLHCRYFDPNLEFCRDEFTHRRVDDTCSLEDNQPTGLRNAEIDYLTRRRIRRIYGTLVTCESHLGLDKFTYNRKRRSSFQDCHHCDHKVNATMSIDHDNLFSLDSALNKMMG